MIQKHTNNTEYWVYNDDPKLPVIVMIHGLRGTHHGLDLIAKNLPGYRIVVPDLPGFGESKPLDSEHSIDNYTIWLCDFMLELNLTKPPILLGHSFGSIITAYYAKKYPNSIKKLILVNPIGAPALEGPSAITTRLAIFYYWLGKALPERLGKSLLSSKPIVLIMSVELAKTKNKKTRKFIHHQHLQHFSTFSNTKMLDEAFKASITHDVREAACDITVPTLLIAGELDEITPIEKQRQLQKLFPNAKLVEISGVGHLTHYETPDQVADAIMNFTT